MPKTTPKNALYAQSGGVSAVINATACGVIETARKHPRHIGKVYAGRHGIVHRWSLLPEVDRVRSGGPQHGYPRSSADEGVELKPLRRLPLQVPGPTVGPPDAGPASSPLLRRSGGGNLERSSTTVRGRYRSPMARRSRGPTLVVERELWDAGHEVVVGVDEVGRGAWAGPLTIGAAVLPRDRRVYGVRDSKQLTEIRREQLFERVGEWCVAWAVGKDFQVRQAHSRAGCGQLAASLLATKRLSASTEARARRSPNTRAVIPTLVAVSAVEAVERGEDGQLTVIIKQSGERLPVSRRLAAEALRKLRG